MIENVQLRDRLGFLEGMAGRGAGFPNHMWVCGRMLDGMPGKRVYGTQWTVPMGV
jgi:hypothetical protein